MLTLSNGLIAMLNQLEAMSLPNEKKKNGKNHFYK